MLALSALFTVVCVAGLIFMLRFQKKLAAKARQDADKAPPKDGD